MPSDIDRAFNYESYRSSVTLHYLLSGFNTDIAVHFKLCSFQIIQCVQLLIAHSTLSGYNTAIAVPGMLRFSKVSLLLILFLSTLPGFRVRLDLSLLPPKSRLL